MITRPQRFTRHGLSPPSPSKQKSRGQRQTHSCVYHWPRLSKHWPRLMSIRCSVLQKRQKTTRLVAVVSGSILSSFLLPRQVGHWRNPSFTVSLPEKPWDCNTFQHSFPFNNIVFKPEKIYKKDFSVPESGTIYDRRLRCRRTLSALLYAYLMYCHSPRLRTSSNTVVSFGTRSGVNSRTEKLSTSGFLALRV